MLRPFGEKRLETKNATDEKMMLMQMYTMVDVEVEVEVNGIG